MGRKHSKEEVLKSLRAKGCIITDVQPITKHEQELIPVSKETVTNLFNDWLSKLDTARKESVIMQCVITNQVPVEFVQKHKKQLEPKRLNKTVTVQKPFTINVSPATNLGNGSWGKIDYLCKVHDYRVVRL